MIISMLQSRDSVSKPFKVEPMEGPSPHSEADKEEMRQVLKEHLKAGAGRGTLGNWRDWEHTALPTPKKVQFSRITHWSTCAEFWSLPLPSPTFVFCCPTHSLVQRFLDSSTYPFTSSPVDFCLRSVFSTDPSFPFNTLPNKSWCLVSGARKRIRSDCSRLGHD
jgi:hypothetical protein